MDIKIEINSNRECFDLIDVDSDQSHDGDGTKELIARVYDFDYAQLITNLLNNSYKEI